MHCKSRALANAFQEKKVWLIQETLRKSGFKLVANQKKNTAQRKFLKIHGKNYIDVDFLGSCELFLSLVDLLPEQESTDINQ